MAVSGSVGGGFFVGILGDFGGCWSMWAGGGCYVR